MKHILQDNALESWGMAINYCNSILDGKATLGHRKFFVSSLHNAVELFVKQRMLDINDYRVAEIRNGLSSDGQPAKKYYNATNLNDFFENQDEKTRKSFYSVEFNKISEYSKEAFQEYFNRHGNESTLSDSLALLKKLRNNETHFYIDKTSFLLEHEFQKLHNFMILFYDILQYYSMLPFLGEPYGKELSRFSFDKSPLGKFSYKQAVKKSKFVQQLCKDIENEIYPSNCGDSAYEIAESIAFVLNEKYNGERFNDLWVYVEMLLEYKLLTYSDDIEEYEIEEKGSMVRGYNAYRTFNITL